KIPKDCEESQRQKLMVGGSESTNSHDDGVAEPGDGVNRSRTPWGAQDVRKESLYHRSGRHGSVIIKDGKIKRRLHGLGGWADGLYSHRRGRRWIHAGTHRSQDRATIELQEAKRYRPSERRGHQQDKRQLPCEGEDDRVRSLGHGWIPQSRGPVH